MTATTARIVLAVIAGLVVADSARAQMMTGVPNALQGFSVNRENPVHIKSTTLEVRDKQKRATFIGDVHVAQGDTTMKSNTLDVFYDQEAAPGQPKATPPGQKGAPPAQPEGGQIRRLEAKGNVVVTQKDQIATGDAVVFDTTANTVTLTGNVVVTQGQNILRGDRLTVNLETGVSTFEGRPGVPVSGLFLPNSARAEMKPGDAKPEPKPNGGNGPARSKQPPARQAPGQPLKLQ
jgi:lipopolysaccharide export system protein LptA